MLVVGTEEDLELGFLGMLKLSRLKNLAPSVQESSDLAACCQPLVGGLTVLIIVWVSPDLWLWRGRAWMCHQVQPGHWDFESSHACIHKSVCPS